MKELEALERLAMPDELRIEKCKKLNINDLTEDYEIVKQALLRLEAIDNANPNKALKTLEVLYNTISPLLEPILAEYEDDLNDKITANYFVLKQELLKAQEIEKVLEIINEKNVDIGYLKTCKTLEEYNSNCWNDEEDFNKKLTQEEFDTLKRYLCQNE